MMTPSEETKNRPGNRGIFMLVAGVVLLLLFGIAISLVVALFLLRGGVDRATIATGASSGSEIADVAPQALVPTLTPIPVILLNESENGVDYETARLANIYRQVNRSVVNVTVFGSGASVQSLLPQAPGDAFPLDPDDLYNLSSGSGFMWDSQGHVVTNHHVVEGADEVQITFYDGRVAVAEILGSDVDSDLAVLKIDPQGYEIVPIRKGVLDDVFVGMRVAAIGNPFGLEGTLTSGIVSALGRSIPSRVTFNIAEAIQTDAAINPGNSGGPLLNELGELIGVNAQIISEERANSGVGFAIPITIVARVVPALITEGRYSHPFIGISGRTFSPICAEELALARNLRGAVVIEVLRGTPAARGGLRGGQEAIDTNYPMICPSESGGDLITQINGEAVTSFDDVLIYLQRYTAPGSTVTLTVLRDGAYIALDITLSERP